MGENRHAFFAVQDSLERMDENDNGGFDKTTENTAEHGSNADSTAKDAATVREKGNEEESSSKQEDQIDSNKQTDPKIQPTKRVAHNPYRKKEVHGDSDPVDGNSYKKGEESSPVSVKTPPAAKRNSLCLE